MAKKAGVQLALSAWKRRHGPAFVCLGIKSKKKKSGIWDGNK
jgi:hypothetical protein